MLVYFGVIAVVLIGFCGLAIDAGRMELRTAQLQAAADEGAISAAAEVQRDTHNTQIQSAQNAASTNTLAFLTANNISTAGSTNTSISIANATGAFGNDLFAVKATISQSLPVYLTALITKNASTTVSVSATALVPPCVFLFSTPGTAAGNAGLALSGAGFYSQCPLFSRTGMSVDGKSSYDYGQPRMSGGSANSSLAGSVFPTPVYNTPVLPDPLGYIAAPTFSKCDYNGSVYTTVQVLRPGTYCGGLTVKGTSVTFSPGQYIVTGGVHFMSNATINGTGVTVYLTQGGGSGFVGFRLDTGSKMYLSAPTDASAGGIPGILLFADRNWVGGNEDFIFDTATYQGDGIIYARGTGIYDHSCNLTGPNYFTIVAENMYSSGSTTQITNGYSALPGGNPIHAAVSLVQ